MPAKARSPVSVLPDFLAELANSLDPADTVAPLAALERGGNGLLKALFEKLLKGKVSPDELLRNHVVSPPSPPDLSLKFQREFGPVDQLQPPPEPPIVPPKFAKRKAPR